MRILFVDDEVEHVATVAGVIQEALDADVVVANTVKDAVAALHHSECDLVVMDIFIPMGRDAMEVLGPRARRYEQDLGAFFGDRAPA